MAAHRCRSPSRWNAVRAWRISATGPAGTALECYSGGAWYRKTVTLNEDQTRGRILLHLGDVAATAEVHVNGRLAGTPRRAALDSRHQPARVKAGENRIEILVYNTLANHYLTVPNALSWIAAFGPDRAGSD